MIGACGCASAIATTCRIASTEPAHELASAARAHVQRTQCTAVQRGPVDAVRTRLEGDVPAAGRKELANDLLRFVERRHTRRHANALDRRSLRCERAAADAQPQPQRWLKQYARLLVAKGRSTRNGSMRIGTIGPYHPAHVDTHHTPAGLTCSCPSRPYRVTRKWPLEGTRTGKNVSIGRIGAHEWELHRPLPRVQEEHVHGDRRADCGRLEDLLQKQKRCPS